MAGLKPSFLLPLTEKLLDLTGVASRSWEIFFRNLYDRVSSLGVETLFTIANNQAVAADITGLQFNKSQISAAFIDFLVQRVTTSTGAVELLEAGHLTAVYEPTSLSWSLVEVSVNSPDNSGVTFSITATGQMQYTSSSITGTASISRVVYRARTLAAKSNLYSSLGGGS